VNKVLILGASGMLGYAMFNWLREDPLLEVFGTVRSKALKRYFSDDVADLIFPDIDIENIDRLCDLLSSIRPDIVVNCVGLVKQEAAAEDPLAIIPINSIFPHRLSRLCGLINARLIHISTDCVFSGDRGLYSEDQAPDAKDLYGKSKYLGEVSVGDVITVRTSIIGHELFSSNGLVEWFLSEEMECRGYTNAIFSGLPTIVLADIIRRVVIPASNLRGVYHVGAAPISKYALLVLIAAQYGKDINIIKDDHLKIDRSLKTELFEQATGYKSPEWPALIEIMHSTKEYWTRHV